MVLSKGAKIDERIGRSREIWGGGHRVLKIEGF